MVLIAGPIFQLVFFMLVKNYISYSDYLIFRNYNYAILVFNMLPVYPLDGGRLLNLFLCKVIPYKYSLKISIYISFIISIILFIKYSSISFYLVLVFLVIKVIEEKNKISYYYNKFILERFLYNLKFKKIKIIKRYNSFYRDRYHIINVNGQKYNESEYLSKINTGILTKK